jgi:DnaA family protein
MDNVVQLPLNIQLREIFTFENFIIGKNQPLIAALDEFLFQSQGGLFSIWSEPHQGLSHFLQAISQKINTQHALYFPCEELLHFPTEIFSNIENIDIIILDNIERLAKKTDWELALFNLYNNLMSSNKKLIAGSHITFSELPFSLKDLFSRLQSGVTFKLLSPDDADKKLILQMHASKYGLKLPENVSTFLLTHYSRDLITLLKLLDQLDNASLREKRKLTVPFVKEILSYAPGN